MLILSSSGGALALLWRLTLLLFVAAALTPQQVEEGKVDAVAVEVCWVGQHPEVAVRRRQRKVRRRLVELKKMKTIDDRLLSRPTSYLVFVLPSPSH